MQFEEFRTYFTELLDQNGILPLSEGQIRTFYTFLSLLSDTNKTTNLTAIREPTEIVRKHFTDSLTASRALPTGARVLDLGCGPGFPSLPLAIARPDLRIFCLDSTEKKIAFVRSTAETLRLSNISAYAGRSEDANTRAKLGSFDVVISRAVSRLNVLCELCLPYARLRGKMIAMKGAKWEEELAVAQSALAVLGGTATAEPFSLVSSGVPDEMRCFIHITKTKPTPSKYPRQYSAILKKPL